MPTTLPAGQPASDQLPRARPRRTDAVIAAVCLLLSGSVSLRLLAGLHLTRAIPVALLLLAHSGLLSVLRPRPVLVHATVLTAGVAVVSFGLPSLVLAVTPLAATYLAASATTSRGAVAVLAMALGWNAVISGGLEHMSTSTTVSNLVAATVVWTLGRVSAQRAANIDALRQRADALELARGADAERAVVEERLRIARELHDIVAHGLGVITIQSGVAAHLELPADEARRTLAQIEQLSREATEEMRRVLTVLRTDGERPAERQPLPDEHALPALLRTFEDAGLDVELTIEGHPGPLPAGTGLAVHRIVQEALTNVLKHATSRQAWLQVSWESDQVVIEVVSGGARPRPAGIERGHGLVGMHERVTAAGGTLHAAPDRTGQAFVVRATLPRGGSDAPRTRPRAGEDDQ